MTEEIKTEISTDCSYYQDVVKNEIYIDGVNVAGCQCFENDKCLWCKKYYESNATPNCKEVKDCYYKRLQRLKQENEKLKEDIKQYCNWLDEEREDNDKLQKAYQDDHCDLLNYRKALEEIRECAKFAQSLPCADIDCDCANCNDETTNNGQFCMEKSINEIKQIVNEVLNDSHTN